MQLGAAGKRLIQSFEALRLKAYPDEAGIPTIGWGHTRGVKLGDTCTVEQASAWFAEDAQEAIGTVNRAVSAPLTQNQFDALVAFTFNVGGPRAEKSTLLRMVNAENYAGAAQQFGRWVYSGGHVSNGLIRRRAAERALFLQADT